MKSGFSLKSIFILSVGVITILAGCTEVMTQERRLEDILVDFHDHNSNNVLIAAHRSMHRRYPENSLAAIKDAIDHGVGIVEIDVRTTLDGEMILMHNSTIDHMTNGEGKVSELAYEQLEQYNLNAKDGDTVTYRIPLLEDALNLAHGKIMVDLDIKNVYVKQLVNMVHKTNTGNQVLFFDSDFEVLDSVLLMDQALMIMPRAHSQGDVTKIFERYNPEVIHIDESFFTEEVVKQINSGGARIWINALGKPDILAVTGIISGYKSLVEGGANIIQTDKPVLLGKYLSRNNLR